MSFHVLRGDARHLPLADASVQCVVTSPPYFGLRSYGVGTENGELGLESTPELYVASMVGVFREVWRVLRPDGTAWLNLGDSYASQGGAHGGRKDNQSGVGAKMVHNAGRGDQYARCAPGGLKPKDLIGIPWRVAFALQADGWWLRSEIIWHKPAPMPESVTDRPTKAHEQVFLLSKAPRYYYDAEAVKEPANYGGYKDARAFDGKNTDPCEDPRWEKRGVATRNKRTVWTIATQPCALSHFATMPPDLAETCIKAGTSERGCCPTCGAPWERVVERSAMEVCPGPSRDARSQNGQLRTQVNGTMVKPPTSTALGWQPTCACPEHEPVPCVVLDPFGGAGTTMLVADRLNRRGVGVELNGDYARMAYNRCYQDAPLLAFAQEALP